jgi:hypothetical protein
MIALYWLRSLIRVAPGRTLATAAGIALAVAFAATLAIFVISASYTMTARAVANVPVDWQVEMAPGIDRGAAETVLDQVGVAKLVRSVDYAKVDGFTATTGDTQQVTGPGCMRAWAMRSASIGLVSPRRRCESPVSQQSRISSRSFRRLACLPALRRNRRPTTS